MAVDHKYEVALEILAEQVKARVEHVLSEQGISHADLGRRLGFKNDSGYWKMYSNGTFDLRKAALIATSLNIDPERILLGLSPATDRTARPFVEERLEVVERELRQVKNQLKKR